ncbi:MAG: carbonic anhydrase [Gaiellales bacterium]|jgi:carbonic anhydrase|nr:carbonic anhydrase [Gaiellales bacterium]MDX6551480.1 carbonic anhydrase [Gaiellales bacterium]
MSELDRMIEANREYTATFADGGKPMPPARHVAILTCMDARIHPEPALGLKIGDAHMIRNAGGRASDDAIRSLIISSRLLGTNEFAVIHHTDCGMVTFSNDDLRKKLADEAGSDASDIDFLPFSDLRQSVIDDVHRILDTPHLDDSIPVSGYIYDVHSGALEQVVSATTRATA